MSSFHDIVFALLPRNQKTKSTTYWVAVLKYVVQPATQVYREEDFLWIKCHGSISVKTIHEQYMAKHPEDGEIKLKLSSKVPSDTTLMRDLDEFNDRMIVFKPFKLSDPSARTSVERVPLQPIKHQLTALSDPDELSSKSPSGIPKYQVPTPTPQDENFKPTFRHVATPPTGSYRPLPAAVAQLPPYQWASYQTAPYKTTDPEPSLALPPAPCSTAPHPVARLPVAHTDSVPAAAEASPWVVPPNSSQYVASATPEWAIPQGFEVFADRHREKRRLIDATLDECRLSPGKMIIGLY